MERVKNGASLFIFDNADRWAQMLDRRSIYYITSNRVGNGRYFVSEGKYLDGLPEAMAMNWEYQIFYQQRGMTGLNFDPLGTEMIVGLSTPSRKDIYHALTRVPFANGQIFLSTLNIVPNLASDSPQSSVAKKLFLNLLENSGQE